MWRTWSRFWMFVCAVGFALCLCACGGGDGTGQLSFVMSHMVEGQPVSLGTDTPYVNEAGNPYGVARLQYFLSGIVLRREGADSVTLPGTHYIDAADQITARFVLKGEIPKGTYSGISFVFGLGPADNVSGSLTGAAENLMAWPEMMGAVTTT